MTRIEEDATASDDLLTKSWTNSEGPRVIRTHRAPRNLVVRRVVVTLALAALAGMLSAFGLSQRDVSPADPAAWVGGDELAIALADDPTPTILDPMPQREQTSRASRSQRRPSASASVSTARWVSPLLGKLRPTSCFGENRGDHKHAGLDLDGETGDTVRSIGVGRVVQVGYRFSGAGLTVTVRYENTLVLYAHLSKTFVHVDSSVKAGQKVGELGSTGNSTGSHLHLGVSKTTSLGKFWDRATNPVPWLEARGIAVPAC